MPRIVLGTATAGLMLALLFPHLERLGLQSHITGAIAICADTDGREHVIIRDLTWFSWDRLHIFGPYTPADEIERKLKFSWDGAQAASRVLADDGYSLLAFARKASVTRYLYFHRPSGDFTAVYGESFTPADAIFDARYERRPEDDRRFIIVRVANREAR
jgi:hypothetical protein